MILAQHPARGLVGRLLAPLRSYAARLRVDSCAPTAADSIHQSGDPVGELVLGRMFKKIAHWIARKWRECTEAVMFEREPEALGEYPKRLPECRDRAVIEAMACTSNARFVCWERRHLA